VAGERCIGVLDDTSVADVREALSAYGVDVRRAVDQEALCFLTRDQWREPGELDSERKLAQVNATLEQARDAGFSGVRFAVNASWTLGPDIPVESVRHWEATVDAFEAPPDMPLSVICQYNHLRLPSALLEVGLRTHSLVVLEAQRYSNPYFDGPGILSGEAPAAAPSEGARVTRMLSQLRRTQLMDEAQPRSALAAERPHLPSLAGIAQGVARQSGSNERVPKANEEALSIVSHELRTPIATILGSAQVMTRLKGELPEEEQVTSLAAIVEEALRLGHVIDDLFVLAHVEDDRELLIEPVALGHLIERHLEVRQRRFPDRRLLFTGGPVESVVAADASYVEQILNNLLDNAERYGSPAAPILVVTAREGPELVVRVIDDGPSVEPAEAELVFEAFSPTTGRTRRAVGAGLAASKRLVEAHGGRIWTQRYDDGGTEFGFTLPLVTEGEQHGQ
jgi:signal transduction histidine kinase